MKQAHIFVSGFVQGVGYRQFLKKNALKRGLKGWVRNLIDGRVEVVLQGDKKSIEELLHVCIRGPFLAEVKNIVVEWEEGEGEYSTFEIMPTS